MSENTFSVIVRKVKDGALRLASQAKAMISFVSGLDDAPALKDCKDQAAAVLKYLSLRKDSSVEDHNAAVKIKARVEHRLGEVLTATVQHGGDRKSSSHSENLNGIPEEIDKNVSSRTQQLARIPWEKIEEKIEEKTAKNEKVSQSRVVKELLQEQQRADNRVLVENAQPLTSIPGVFQAIAIDPPWDWGDEGDVSQMGRGRHEYEGMSYEQLLKFPVGEKADKNCHLYLWITNRSLPKGFSLMEAWGFRYITCLTWCKPSIGMGNYFRGSTEHILFGVRGSLGLLERDVGTWFAADRQGRHSTKPDEFYQLVERCSPGPWLEVFSRKKRNGWTCWGAEA